MTESTTIGDYKVEYDQFGKPSFTDTNGNPVHYTDLKGNELALANNHFKLASGKSKDGQQDINLSPERLRNEARTLMSSTEIKTVQPQMMSRINEFMASLDNMGKDKINGLKDHLKGLGQQIARAIHKPRANTQSNPNRSNIQNKQTTR